MDRVIDTGRLLLRRFTLDDLPAFYHLASRPEIIRYAQSTPVASLEEARELMKAAPLRDYATHGYGRFACVWKETGEVIGFSGLKFVPEIGDTELGYRFFKEYWGKGLATEAGRASIEFARSDLGLTRLVAMVHPENVASAKVVEKLGFTDLGHELQATEADHVAGLLPDTGETTIAVRGVVMERRRFHHLERALEGRDRFALGVADDLRP